MTDGEKEGYKKKIIADVMMYAHIDYDDDMEIIELMVDATLDELKELIPGFDPYNLSPRRRLLVLVSVKELYDNRDKYQKDIKLMTNAVASMLLNQKYGGAL